MSEKLKSHLSLWLCSLILALQLMSALHFIVIKHSLTDENNQYVTTHRCDDYILYPHFTLQTFSWSIPTWITNHRKLDVEIWLNQQKISNYNGLITNKGPPFVEKLNNIST